MKNNKTQLITLMKDLLSTDNVEKNVLAHKLIEHLSQCEFNQHFVEEAKIKAIKSLHKDIELFIEDQNNPAYIDNLKIQLELFPNLIIN